jgi:hypothetical protein
LKAEITRLKASEPRLRGWFLDANGIVIERVEANLQRYEPINATLINGLVERVLAANPEAPSPPIPSTRKPARKGPVDLASIDAELDRQFSPILARAYEKYRADYEAWTQNVRRSLTDLHVTWNRRRDWPAIVFMAVNDGTKPAEAALVELVVEGDFTIERPQKPEGDGKLLDGRRRTSGLEIPMPPAPPVRQTAASLLFGDNSRLLMGDSVRSFDPLSSLSRTRDADAFYWRIGRGKPTTRIELDCANWRHAREKEDFPFVIRGNDGGEIRNCDREAQRQ